MDNAEQNLTNGTANVAVTYDGNASWAMKEKNTIKVADFTSDPIQLGIDLFVMPKGAKHVDLAEKFLNYICTAEVMAKNLEEFPYSCPTMQPLQQHLMIIRTTLQETSLTKKMYSSRKTLAMR